MSGRARPNLTGRRPRIPPCLLSLRCASALPLPSFPTLHPKTGDFARSRLLSPNTERPTCIATFLHPFPTAPSPSKHRLSAIPPSTRLHEVSIGRCPLTRCTVHHPPSTASHFLARCRHRRRDRALPSPSGACGRHALGRLGLEAQLPLQPGASPVPGWPAFAFAVSLDRQGCASIHPTPRAGRGCLVMKSARRIRLSISRRVGLRRLC